MMTDPRALLQRSKTIAVVGCSATPGKDAHEIPRYMLARGYDVHPVNPTAKEIFGRPAYATLADVPRPIDIVNVFRPAEEAPAIARQAIAAGAKALWLQSGLHSPEARQITESAGLTYVEDHCIRTTRQELG
jgi:predicted CoA-binding protein